MPEPLVICCCVVPCYPATPQAWVSATRLIAGVGGFRDDTVPFTDGVNLLIDFGVVAVAVWALRSDLRSRDEDLEKESGRGPGSTSVDDTGAQPEN